MEITPEKDVFVALLEPPVSKSFVWFLKPLDISIFHQWLEQYVSFSKIAALIKDVVDRQDNTKPLDTPIYV